MDRRRERRRGPQPRDHVDQRAEAPFQRALQGRQVVPVPGRHARRRGAAGDGLAQARHPGRPLLRPVSEDVGRDRHARDPHQAVPDPHLQGQRLPAGDGHRQAVLRRPDRALLRAVLGQGHDRGAPGQRRPFRRVHAEPGSPHRPRPRARDARRVGRAGLRDGGPQARPAAGRHRVLREERGRARRPRRPRRVRHRARRARGRGAPVHGPRRPHPGRTLVDGRQGARRSARRAGRLRGRERLRRRPDACPSCPTVPRRSRPGSAGSPVAT